MCLVLGVCSQSLLQIPKFSLVMTLDTKGQMASLGTVEQVVTKVAQCWVKRVLSFMQSFCKCTVLGTCSVRQHCKLRNKHKMYKTEKQVKCTKVNKKTGEILKG